MTNTGSRAMLPDMDGASDIRDKTLYERDFFAWAQAQAEALRARRMDTVDWENVIEEIETLGRSERSALRSAIGNILEHLIKLDHGLNRDPERGWKLTVSAQRRQAKRTLKDNPSLRPTVASLVIDEYPDAREAALAAFEVYEPDRLAQYETTIPMDCPYSKEAVLGAG